MEEQTKYNKTKPVCKALFLVLDNSSKSGKCRLLTVVPTNYFQNHKQKKRSLDFFGFYFLASFSSFETHQCICAVLAGIIIEVSSMHHLKKKQLSAELSGLKILLFYTLLQAFTHFSMCCEFYVSTFKPFTCLKSKKKERFFTKVDTYRKNVNQYKSWSRFVVTARFPNIWENGCVCVNELWITGFK